MLVKIANLIIKITGQINQSLTEILKNYIIEEGNYDVLLDLEVNNNIPIPTEQLYGPYKTFYYSRTSNGSLNTYSIPEGLDRCTMKCTLSNDFKTAKVQVIDVTDVIVGFDLGKFMNNAIGHIFLIAILYNNGFVIHGSSIAYNNNGIIFSAKSGTGKSTQTKLWQDNLNDVVVVNDDTPAITFENDTVFLNGTPFAGTTGINENLKVPLKAVVFIERAKEPYIEKLSFKEAIPRFMDEMKKSLVSENISECVDYAAKLMEKVPVYLLHCNMEKESVTILKETLKI